ncbi:MAG: hypothetical protein ACQ9MH_26655, partial [Nitrospinales bacterium]
YGLARQSPSLLNVSEINYVFLQIYEASLCFSYLFGPTKKKLDGIPLGVKLLSVENFFDKFYTDPEYPDEIARILRALCFFSHGGAGA